MLDMRETLASGKYRPVGKTMLANHAPELLQKPLRA
jgi:hypothetical protein